MSATGAVVITGLVEAQRWFEKASRMFDAALGDAMRVCGYRLRDMIRLGIRDQAPGGKPYSPPLSPWTLAARKYRLKKKGTKIHIASGAMLRSINVQFTGKGAATVVNVGVKRGAREANGKDVVNIARVQEFGAGPFAIPFTPKMRGYLAKLAKDAGLPPSSGGGGGAPVIIVKIPARPFLRPAFAQFVGMMPDLFEEEFRKALIRRSGLVLPPAT